MSLFNTDPFGIMYLNENIFRQTVRFIPELELMYINNPKVACSSIKKALWERFDEKQGEKTYQGSPHEVPLSPFLNSNQVKLNKKSFLEAIVFSVVRNPYARILSAYLDKIYLKRDPRVWKIFCDKTGVEVDDNLSLLDFLRIINSLDTYEIDPHFRPQYVNLLLPYMDYDFIGHMEDIAAVESFFKQFNINLGMHSPHKTGAMNKVVDYIGGEEKSIIDSLFSIDFKCFGYSDSLDFLEPRNDVVVLESLGRGVILDQVYE